MSVNLRKIEGNWDVGYALDKHIISSVYMGNNQSGHAVFDTKRTQVGEAVYQLKYKQDWLQVPRLASAVMKYVVPLVGDIGLIVPMPASTQRPRQPVTEVALALAKLIGVKVFSDLLVGKAVPNANQSLKNMHTKAEKEAALLGRFSIKDGIAGEGKWNALLLDDLFDSGASMEAACSSLRTYAKIDKIFAVALTWK